MRKIDELAQKKFGGDIEKALEYLLHHNEEGSMDDYVDELSEEECEFLTTAITNDAIRFLEAQRDLMKN